MEPTVFTILENNPDSLNELSHSLGLSSEYEWYDVYSVDDPDLLAIIPRPVYALLAIIPLTPTWKKDREAENEAYISTHPEPNHEPSTTTATNPPTDPATAPILWYKQTIINGCGSIGMLHSIFNSDPSLSPSSQSKSTATSPPMILPSTPLADLLSLSLPLSKAPRARLLHDFQPLHAAHEAAAAKGSTSAPAPGDHGDHEGQHFVAFVKNARDGHLWELEGDRAGPLDRGGLAEDEDALSERAIQLGIGRLIEMERRAGGGDLRFSVLALAKKW